MTDQAQTATGRKHDVKALINRNRRKGTRKIKDVFANAMTWLATGIAVLVLGAVFVFVFQRGWSTLSPALLTSNYWPQNIMVGFEGAEPGSFEAPADLREDAFFSSRYGIALRDARDPQQRVIMAIDHVDPDSPANDGVITTAGDMQGEAHELPVEGNLMKFSINLEDGSYRSAGLQARMSAEETVALLDSEAVSLRDAYYQTAGGGIRGSLIATLLLIVLTLAVALPLGIFAAIYLNEVAVKGRIVNLFRSSIELLSGVPSIIFGLVGITMLFPITALFGISTMSLLLGALTMSIVLLPVIIRQTEEALRVVPDGIRMSSLSLGATRTQTIFRVILPNALPGILSATLLSVSRIIGESAALIFTMGTAISDNPSVGTGGTTLAVQIWSIMSSDRPNFALASAISIIILILVLILNITVKIVSNRLNRKWK